MNLTDLVRAAVPRVRSPNARDGKTPQIRDVLTVDSPGIVLGHGGSIDGETAKRLSAVYAAIDIRAGTMSTLPDYIMADGSKDRYPQHDLVRLLNLRPNAAMSAATRKYLLEQSILLHGNAYDWIVRDPGTGKVRELIPLPGNLVTVKLDKNLVPWYLVEIPETGEAFRLDNQSVCHYKGPSKRGYVGQSALEYASDCISAGVAAQSYNRSFYESGGQPSGVLTVDTDLGGYVVDENGNPTDQTVKDKIRDEWAKTYGGPTNAHRIAVLDHGMKYQALTISQKDSMFIEQQKLTVEDIARYIGVPLYKLQSGKQSYQSNEQNAIEYLSNMQPRITMMEQEQTYKLLLPSEIAAGMQIRKNMAAVLRADNQSRAAYYREMKYMGVYSVNEIRDLEDRPPVEGGDDHAESLNYVPLSLWHELSINRNQAGGGSDE